jgi:hypothetical protein
LVEAVVEEEGEVAAAAVVVGAEVVEGIVVEVAEVVEVVGANPNLRAKGAQGQEALRANLRVKVGPMEDPHVDLYDPEAVNLKVRAGAPTDAENKKDYTHERRAGARDSPKDLWEPGRATWSS